MAAGRRRKRPSDGVEVTFSRERETKGTIRYAEDGVKEGERGVVGVLYLQKSAASKYPGGVLPDAVTITIREA